MEQALRDADGRKDEVLAVVAHELRNPLAPILNAVQILGIAPSDSSAARQAREIIRRQVAHVSRLIEDLLDLSAIRSR